MGGAGEYLIKILTDTTGVSKGVKKAEQDVAKAADAVEKSGSKIGKALGGELSGKVNQSLGSMGSAGNVLAESFTGPEKAAAAAAVGIAAFVVKGVSEFQKLGTEVGKFSKASGMAAEDASRWVAVADDYQVSTESLSGAFGKLAKTVALTPSKLTELGVEIARNKDGTANLSGTIANVATAFNRTQDGAQKAALGTAAFGKSWQDMVPLLAQGGDQLSRALEDVDKHQIVSDEDVKKAEEFRLAMDNLRDSVGDLERIVGSQFIEYFTNRLTIASQAIMKVDDALGAVSLSIPKMVNFLNPLGPSLDLASRGWHKLFGGGKKEVWEAADGLEVYAAGTKRAIEALDEFTWHEETAEERTKRLTKATADSTKAEDDYRRAIQKSSEARLDAMGIGLDLFRSEQDLGEAVDEFNAKAKEKTKTTKEAAEKAADLADKQRDLEDRILGTAKAAAEYAANQAEAAGKTFTAADKANAMIGELENLKGKFPELTPFIDDYIAKLREIPGTINTTLSAETKGVAAGSGRIVRASGGTIPGHLGEMVPFVGHAGEQVGTPGSRSSGGGGDMSEVVKLLRYIATHSRWTAAEGAIAQDQALVGFR